MSKPALDFNTNGTAFNQAINDIRKDYSLVYFAPDSKSVGKRDTGKCMAFAEYENLPSVAMKPLDRNLHTHESCKLNAGMMQSDDKWQNFMKYKTPSKASDELGSSNIVERGLKYKVVEGYFADNPEFFKSAKILSTGIAKTFDNITNSTNGYIKLSDSDTQQPRYSVEWYGTFTPPTTGKWKFSTSNSNASYVWIGKYAMSNMSAKNSIVNNGGLHDTRNVESKPITLQSGIPYPIRIQFGENSRGHNIQIALHLQVEKRIFVEPIVENFFGRNVPSRNAAAITAAKNAAAAAAARNAAAAKSTAWIPSAVKTTAWIPSAVKTTAAIPAAIPTSIKPTYAIPAAVVIPAAAAKSAAIIPATSATVKSNAAIPAAVVIPAPVKRVVRKGEWKITYESIPYKFEDMVTSEVNVKDVNLYYALVEETPALSSQGLYKCYITDTTNSNISTTKNNFKYKIIWRAFDEKNESRSVQPGNYAYYRNNQLIVCDKDGTIVKSFGDPDMQTSSSDFLQLDNNGNILLRGTQLTNVNANGALVNPVWKTEKYILDRSDTLTSADGDIIRRTFWDNQQLLISENGKFKLEMTENGNLVIKESLMGCSGSASDGTKYTTSNDNLFGKSYYLYEAAADMKMDKTFMAYAKDNNRTLKRINMNGVDMKKGKGYTQYDNYAPSNTDNAVTVDNIAACKTKCTDDNNCDYYYSYVTKDGKNNCKTGTNNGSTPFIPIQPDSGIKSSQLYIRSTDMNLPSADVRNTIPKNTTSEYTNYAAYNVSPALYELGDAEIMQKIQTAADRQDKIMNGKNGKNGKEGFNDRGYKTSKVVNAKYAVQPTPDGLATAIQTQQISPLTQIAGDYNTLMANINSEYNTIGTNVSAATSLRDDLKNNTRAGYLENNYDMVPPIKRVEDVRLDDINELISQTNTTYTLGTITAMTIIIAGIFVMRN